MSHFLYGYVGKIWVFPKVLNWYLRISSANSTTFPEWGMPNYNTLSISNPFHTQNSVYVKKIKKLTGVFLKKYYFRCADKVLSWKEHESHSNRKKKLDQLQNHNLSWIHQWVRVDTQKTITWYLRDYGSISRRDEMWARTYSGRAKEEEIWVPCK